MSYCVIVLGIILLQGTSCEIPKEFPVSQIVREEMADTSQILTVNSDTLIAQKLIRSLYVLNSYEPLWEEHILDDSSFNALIEIIENSKFDGLYPSDYHLEELKTLRDQLYPEARDRKIPRKKQQLLLPIPENQVKIDFLLSDAFMTLAIHSYLGRVSEKNVRDDLSCTFHEMNLPQFLLKAVKENNINTELQSLAPDYPQYKKLKGALKSYLEIENQYPDSAEINEKLELIRINMERWKWLTKKKYDKMIIVNIPQFRMKLYDKDSIIFDLKTIVGKENRRTPIFNCELKYVVFNPTWNIPKSIVRDEILPKVRRDVSYLRRNHIMVVKSGRGKDRVTISPTSVNWNAIKDDHIPFMLVQSSGKDNPLGAVKFLFPNQYNVYLHDTNAPYLFSRDKRAFSHGCIRVEKAQELAAYFMKDSTLLNKWEYKKRFEEDDWNVIKPPVEVFINYWTVWVDNGNIQFFNDLYKKDQSLLDAFKLPVNVLFRNNVCK